MRDDPASAEVPRQVTFDERSARMKSTWRGVFELLHPAKKPENSGIGDNRLEHRPTFGIVFNRTALNGGNCMMKGAPRFEQYVFRDTVGR